MVDPRVITKRVEQIEKHLDRIRPFASLSHEAFLKDSVAQDVVEYNLFQIVNHLIDPGSRRPRALPVNECAIVWPGCRPTRA